MKEKYHLAKQETEVMRRLWALGEPIRQVQLLELLHHDGLNWSRQVLNTLLIRMQNRGLIARENRTVRAVYDQETFGMLVLQQEADRYFDGDLGEMIAAYVRHRRLSAEQAEGLKKTVKQYIKQRKQD